MSDLMMMISNVVGRSMYVLDLCIDECKFERAILILNKKKKQNNIIYLALIIILESFIDRQFLFPLNIGLVIPIKSIDSLNRNLECLFKQIKY
ncbi:hypothetical protein DERP_001983 [Dermatophagoides pteronyssinus]|uniref:Uncharacterized protein n=1 Tax=Dermatophagoides pteronyssinus TaxID=6956 RepID=A0ABQ8JCK8_DERPT|nr:hypothetical protein DERP_001983 [Dermatophagoides pteronyssinus]